MSASKSSSCDEHTNYTLRTIKQIYSMCKQFPPNYSYGNEKIGRMILDDRTISLGTIKVLRTPVYWKEYSKVDDTNSGTFMYLVNRISK